jgi:hypothetical protein
MFHVRNHCIFKLVARGAKDYIARGQTDGMANVKLTISTIIHGSAPVERVRV